MFKHEVSERGFSLIELIVAMALAGILVTIGVLSTKKLREGYDLKGAARQIYSDMQLARLGAVKTGEQWFVCLDPGDDNFSTYRITTTSTAGGDGDVCTGDDTYEKEVDMATLFPGVSCRENFSGQSIVFNANGSASSGTITLEHNNGRSKSVTVNQFTGRMRIN